MTTEKAHELLEEIEELIEDIREEVETAGDIPTLELPSQKLCKLAPRLAAVSEELQTEQDGEDEGTELVEQPAVVEPLIGKSYEYFTHHKTTSNGRGSVIYGYRTDVTEAAEKMVERQIGNFLEYVKDAYNLKLYYPKVRKDDNGDTWLDSVQEITGYEYLSDLVAEWREKGER